MDEIVAEIRRYDGWLMVSGGRGDTTAINLQHVVRITYRPGSSVRLEFAGDEGDASQVFGGGFADKVAVALGLHAPGTVG